MENAFFKTNDFRDNQILGYPIPPEWWSRLYEYPWAIRYAGPGMVVADMGCGYEPRPFKDALAQVADKVYAVDASPPIPTMELPENVEFVVANFTQPIDAIPEGSLDRVFCISVLEELSDWMPLALREFRRCLKRGGLCVLTADVQYDLDKPTPFCGGIDLDLLETSVSMLDFRLRFSVDLSKENAMYSDQFNLCCFHCVLVKP